MDDVLLEMVDVCRGFIGGNGEAGETLTQIAALGATALDADMAGLTLSDTHAGPRTAVCTDRIVRGIEQSQYDADRGPCLDASRDGDCYRVAGTDDDWARWPEFLSAARSHGVNSSLSVPVIVAGRPIAALNFYSQHSAHFDDRMARRPTPSQRRRPSSPPTATRRISRSISNARWRTERRSNKRKAS